MVKLKIAFAIFFTLFNLSPAASGLTQELFMTYTNLTFDEERALYAVSDSVIENCRFDGPRDGDINYNK